MVVSMVVFFIARIAIRSRKYALLEEAEMLAELQ
jgi:hypothetical protein